MNLNEYLILNVDDYDPGRYARTHVLRQAGFTMLEASSGRQALEIVAQRKPALVLLDVNLPDISGFEVCRRIRSDSKSAATIVLQISATNTDAQQMVAGFNAGADSYLVEPVDPAVLVATIKALLRAREAEEALRRSNEDLNRFAYAVAHELSEPLRTIMTQVELLSRHVRGGTPDQIAESCEFVVQGAQRMRSFIEVILRYSQVTHRGPEICEFEAEEMLERILFNLQTMILDKGARITRDPLPSITADVRIEQVLQNLITNALKYGREGVPAEVHISAQRRANGWQFMVRDNGVGIESQYRSQVFEMFRRLHGREVPGYGIGLALCKRIVEASGGTMWVESEPGCGSTFYFTIPEEFEEKQQASTAS